MPSNIPKHALRKAAILVSALDRDVAEHLLEQMPEDDARAVRSAASRLGDVSESEQERIVEEFYNAQRPAFHDESADDGGVELAPSLARRFATNSFAPPAPPRRFAILDRASVSSIARVLSSERPQTTALVLSNMEPQRAADVLAQWPEALQTEVLERVARLEEPDPEFVAEIETHLEHALRDAPTSDRTPGLPLAAAILRKADPRLQQALVERLATRDERLATSLAPEADENAESSPARARIPFTRETKKPRSASGGASFAQLAALDNRAWLAILGDSDPQVAVLALAGADGELVERILKSLPRKERKRLRREMDGIGALRLRDVERAQERIAHRAAELAAAGAIPRFDRAGVNGPQLAAA